MTDTTTPPSEPAQPLGLGCNEQLGATLAACRPAFEDMAATMRRALDAAHALADVWYSIAEREYMKMHGKLPGSTRTVRLRKKRRAIVLEWWARKCGFTGA